MTSEQAEELSALLAQVEFGDYNQNTAQYCYSLLCSNEPSQATVNSIIIKHRALEGLSTGSAEYQALQLVSSLEHYGVEWHWARDGEGQKLAVGVGPEGVSICKQDFSLINRITYPIIQIATQSGKNVYLTITKETCNSVVLLKLISTRAASALYRAVTETHAFYRCDTVTSTVMMQYSRDFKGHLASLFLNENISLGKKYIFDIQRTSKEACMTTPRRILYNAGCVDFLSRAGERSPVHSPVKTSDGGANCDSCRQSQDLQEKLQSLREALLCMLCCEEQIDSAFCPCGHMVCCQNCATQLQSCPVCRSEVDHIQHVYLPTCASLFSLARTGSTNLAIHRGLASHNCPSKDYLTDEKICRT